MRAFSYDYDGLAFAGFTVLDIGKRDGVVKGLDGAHQLDSSAQLVFSRRLLRWAFRDEDEICSSTTNT